MPGHGDLTIEWLETTQIGYFILLEARSPKVKISDRLHPFWKF